MTLISNLQISTSPGPMDAGATFNGFNTFILDATTDLLSWVFQMSEAATITSGGFRYGVRAGTCPTYRISLQGVDSSGNPDGVIKGGGSPVSTTFTPPADTSWNSLWKWQTFANSYAASVGEHLALVIDYSAGTINASNSSTFTYTISQNTMRFAFPYSITNNAGTPTRNVTAWPVFGVKSSTTAYGIVVENSTTTGTYNSNSTPDEYAIAWSLPAGSGDTYTVTGVKAILTTPAAAKTFTVNLYDTDGTTVLQSVIIDSDQIGSVGGGTLACYLYFDTLTGGVLSNLVFGSTYRIGFVPNETTTALGISEFTVATANDFTCFTGGTDVYTSTRTNAGAWSDVATTRLLVNLLLGSWTEPTASAGGGIRLAGHGGLAA